MIGRIFSGLQIKVVNLDLSWIKLLAEETNQSEISRQERLRREEEERKMVAAATAPFVEKMHRLVDTYAQEFNQHCMFPELRITVSKLHKRNKRPASGSAQGYSPIDEVAYFTFTRTNWLFGVKGINGIIEFIELPVTEGAASINYRLEEMGLVATKTLVATIDPDTDKPVWSLDGHALDAPAIYSLCEWYFRDFIERTSPSQT